MLYVFYGTDRNSVRNAAREITEPLGLPSLIEESTYTKGVITDAVGASSLFGGSECFLLDTPAGDEEYEKEVLSFLDAMAASTNVFVIIEGVLLAEAKKKYGKHATTLQEFAADKPERFNVFQIAETLAKKDKKQMWVLLQEARALGIRDEETIGILWWQLKALRLAKLTKNAAEAGMKDYPYKKAQQSLRNFKEGEVEELSRSLLELYHLGHQGKQDMDLALEEWVLTV